MTAAEARALVDFTYWARNRVLDAVDAVSTEQFTRAMGGSFGSMRDTLVHILWAEAAWLMRWRGEAGNPTLKPEDFPDAASLRRAWAAHEAAMREYFAAVDDARLPGRIAYKALNGTPYETPLWQMLQHVVNHGTYHRGQITTMLRQQGAAPPKSLDLITYYREAGQ